MRRRLKVLAWSAVQRAARRGGFEAVRQHFYSPLPDVARLPESMWTTPREMVGVDLRLDDAIRFMQDGLGPFLAEFRPPRDASGPAGGFFLRNGSYESVDAEILFAIVRHARPRLVVELGSGASSHVISAAAEANAADGAPLRFEVHDPFPFTASPMGPVESAIVHAERAEDIDAAALADRLQSGDVLFVDTTHTVKTGGDVDRIFLDLLPRLAPGVWIHVHDVFLPYEYPRAWVVDERRAWAEQYLLQAFLAFNRSFRVEFPAYAVARAAPEAVAAAIPSFAAGAAPGAFWMRRVAES